MTPIYFFLILINTLILVSGQFLWKYGMQHSTGGFQSFLGVVRLFLSPHVLSGLAMYGVATVLWLFILSRVPLSLAYPIQSLAYIFAAVGAYYVFHEPLSAAKIAGCVLILAGVTLIGWKG
ncbi:MAG: EamA family transporter [Paenibacillaceae bacterium]|jgi:drug/metabolite transporter (DMT)-like permease|nr:EamA family transporter [Paenibacillaceae bacterium]